MSRQDLSSRSAHRAYALELRPGLGLDARLLKGGAQVWAEAFPQVADDEPHQEDGGQAVADLRDARLLLARALGLDTQEGDVEEAREAVDELEGGELGNERVGVPGKRGGESGES